jgi:peptidoglycan/xylan/chitin deacetylase (PgdA/CDA1 family)
MGGKQAMLARWLDMAGVTRARLRSGPSGLTILAYHRIQDLADESRFAADPELVSASVAEFRRQLAFLRERWNPIGLSNAMDVIERGQALPPRSVAITFDDGHLDNYTHAFPLLREMNVPATIFLSTQYIGSREPFWFDRVSTLLFCAPAGPLRLPLADLTLQLGDIASRRAASDRLLSVLKRLADERRRDALQELEALLARHAVPVDAAPTSALDWDQVREMTRHGIEFGSHTVTHPVLSMQTEDRVRFELSQSRETIRRETGQRADLLAYPVGKTYTFNDRVVAIAKECGYRAALAYIDGVNDPSSADRFALKRIAVERYIPHPLFMARMTFPGIFV